MNRGYQADHTPAKMTPPKGGTGVATPVMRSIGYPITEAGWRAIGAAVCWSGDYLFTFGTCGAVFSYRRAERHNPDKRGPRDPVPGENHYQDTYVLTDNGGEVNVSGVNFRPDLPSVPVHDARGRPGENCGPETAAYRIVCVLEGSPVDYDFDVDRELAGT